MSFFFQLNSDNVIILLIKVKNANNYWHFNIYDHDKIYAQLN